MSNFLVLQQELAAQVGLDQTQTAQATLLKRWINNAQQVVLRSFEWPFNYSVAPLTIQTVPDYTTGTVATTAGSTSITFSTAPKDVNGSNVSVANRYIQTSSSNDWYRIATHTSGTTAATLEIGATTTAATATLTIRKVYYSTDATVDRIIQVWQSILPYQLVETSPQYFQSFNPGFLSTGTPRFFMPAGLDSSGYPQFKLWPNPDAVINLYVDYLKVAIDMSADADISVIPAKWHTTVLIQGAKAQAFNFLDDSRYGDSVTLFKDMLEEMKSEYETSLHRHRVMTSADNQPVGGQLGYMPLPYNYPRNS